MCGMACALTQRARLPMRTCGCRLRAKPKSAILSTGWRDVSDKSRFCGLRSRCMRERACKAGQVSRQCRSAASAPCVCTWQALYAGRRALCTLAHVSWRAALRGQCVHAMPRPDADPVCPAACPPPRPASAQQAASRAARCGRAARAAPQPAVA
eukprot:364865-Chlamydomonas_euryale.AAC.10